VKRGIFTVTHTVAYGPVPWKNKDTVELKVGEVQLKDVSVVVVVVVIVESVVREAKWDSACLSSGLNVTDDRDH